MNVIPEASQRVHAWLRQLVLNPSAPLPDLNPKVSPHELKFYQDLSGPPPYDYDPVRNNSHEGRDKQAAKAGSVKRSLNPTFCLAKHLGRTLKELYGITNQQTLNNIAGKLWRQLDEDARDVYEQVANGQKIQRELYKKAQDTTQPKETLIEPSAPVSRKRPAVVLPYTSRSGARLSGRARRTSERGVSSNNVCLLFCRRYSTKLMLCLVPG